MAKTGETPSKVERALGEHLPVGHIGFHVKPQVIIGLISALVLVGGALVGSVIYVSKAYNQADSNAKDIDSIVTRDLVDIRHKYFVLVGDTATERRKLRERVEEQGKLIGRIDERTRAAERERDDAKRERSSMNSKLDKILEHLQRRSN